MEMLERTLANWTSKIIENSRNGLHYRSLQSFLQMLRTGIEPDAATYSATINVCTSQQSLNPNFGLSLHSLILKKGFSNHVFVSTGLVSFYSKCVCIVQARRLFDEMSVRDSVSWSSMISSYTRKGFSKEAIDLFRDMIGSRFCADCFTFASVVKACAGLGCLGVRVGESVHGYVIKCGGDSDYFVCGSMVYMYSTFRNLVMARSIFDGMKDRDLVVWNALITGYVQNSQEEEAINLFYQMQCDGFNPNDTTYTCILNASSVTEDDKLGRIIHVRIFKYGLLTDVFLGTAIVDMYSKFYVIDDAKRVFGEMGTRNLVTYNALMTGYGLIGEADECLKLYSSLHIQGMKPDRFTFMALLSSCFGSNAVSEGIQIHTHSLLFGLESDLSVGNSIVNFYSKCGFVGCALKAFQSIHTPNIISWAGIISGLVQNGENETAIGQYCKMHKLSEKTDEFALSSVLKAVGSLAITEQGRHVHAQAIKTGLDCTIFVSTALINMYSKCGLIKDAYKIFSNTRLKNFVSWNAMITGYAQNGFCKEAMVMFQEMINSEVLPTSVTFTGVLYACSIAGFVEEGKHYYDIMINNYKIPPSVEHCTCMADLLGKAGYLDEATKFILSSPFPKEPDIWRVLLSACGVQNNTDLGSWVSQYCLKLEPRDSSIFTFLSNMHASNGFWDKTSSTRDHMKQIGSGKKPGCSWIEVKHGDAFTP